MTIVLAPPLGATPAVWDAQAEVLDDVVCYEPRRVPRTLADLGNEVLEQVPAERFSFCGLSLGGLVGMWLAANVPERIDRLVLACTAPRFPPPRKWEERAALVRRSGSVAPLAEATVLRWVSHPEPDLVRMVASAAPDVYAGCCDVLAQADLRDALGEIRAPTLVIAGELDEATTPADAAVLAAAIHGATLEVLPGAAHHANVEQPQRFSRLVRRHLLPASPPAGP